ncbi:MAG: type II toxin-antitoxin system HicA family toxin [Candidatus Hydrogenedentes bacterium]|nr:type II toxin-antitoxin system HicA family toxin [Candidatus Hydrogenedentota bacterium]
MWHNEQQAHTALVSIFSSNPGNNIRWDDVESVLRALGAEISEGRGSRFGVKLNDERIVFHRPHPAPTINKGVVQAIRVFLERAGIRP